MTIRGVGFTDANIRVIFTCGKQPVDTFPTKMSLDAPGTYVSETELVCFTPNFEQFGPKEAIV